MINFDARLLELGLELPRPAIPAFSYIPAVFCGNQLFISGQLGFLNGQLPHKGRLGGSATIKDATAAAHLAGLNVLAQVRLACGGTLNQVRRCLRMTGYVSSVAECYQQAEAMNGCSDLIQQVFGEHGRHTRSTIGVTALPFDATVEVDAVFEVLRDFEPETR